MTAAAPAYAAPGSVEELRELMLDATWRLCSGHLYVVKAKAVREGDRDRIVPFHPNRAQRRFLRRLGHRNLILKARQLGMTTFIDLIALDMCLWTPNSQAAIVAHTLDDAQAIFTDKIALVYDHLPEAVRAWVPLTKRTASMLEFRNGSRIRVTTSARSGTVDFLHVSELGKIAATAPHKAREVATGSLQAVPLGAIAVIESTAEGQSGLFYDMCQRAEAQALVDPTFATASSQDWRFHFFGWHYDQGYRLGPLDPSPPIGADDHRYFDRIEAETGLAIDLDQRRWYVAKRAADFAHDHHDFRREYPSTAREAWEKRIEGRYYADALARARRQGRVGHYPLLRGVAVNTFWDLGGSDSTVVWLHQRVGGMDRFVGYREAAGEGYLPFVLWLEARGCIWGRHYLPHDGEQGRQAEHRVARPIDILSEMRPHWDWSIVPRVHDVQHGIDLTRQAFEHYCFDADACAAGLVHIDAYSRAHNRALDAWTDQPRHDRHSHAADALRQHAQGYQPDDRPMNARPGGARRRTPA